MGQVWVFLDFKTLLWQDIGLESPTFGKARNYASRSSSLLGGPGRHLSSLTKDSEGDLDRLISRWPPYCPGGGGRGGLKAPCLSYAKGVSTVFAWLRMDQVWFFI
jgi:hypothetical protein